MERDRALALLAEQHAFPGPFEIRAIIRPGAGGDVEAAVAEGFAGRAEVRDRSERASAKGNWVSLRLLLHVDTAETVLDVYTLLKGHEAVTMAL